MAISATAARLGINTQHRMQQDTAPRTLADLAQTAPAFLGRLEIEFAAVLDRPAPSSPKSSPAALHPR